MFEIYKKVSSIFKWKFKINQILDSIKKANVPSIKFFAVQSFNG